MERATREKLHLLDSFGIVREAFNILLPLARSKLLWGITLTLLLPLSFLTLGLNFISGSLFIKINDRETYYKMEPNMSLSRRKTFNEFTSEWRVFLVFVAVYGAFVLILRMLSTAAVAYTVAFNYTANTQKLKLSYARVMTLHIPRVWKRLTITFFLIFLISLATALLAIVLLLIIFFSAIMGVQAEQKLNWGAFLFGLILVIVFVCLELYIGTVWNLASVVTVLEDKYYGINALQKSNDLIRGKRSTVLPLVMVYFIFSQLIVRGFWYAVVEGRGHGVGTTARAFYGALLVGLLCFVNMMGLLAQSVFYFVCKYYHHESIYDHSSLEILNGGYYGPFETSSNRLLLEQQYLDV